MIYKQPKANEVNGLQEKLIPLLPEPPRFETQEAIDALDYDGALEVLRATRRMLMMTLMYQEYHEHMLDDCGDYLEAATYNWSLLHNVYFTNDGDPPTVTEAVRDFLNCYRDYPMGGCDGEIRYDMIPGELLDQLMKNQEI